MSNTPTPWEAYQYDFEVYKHEFCDVMSHDGEAVAEYATKADAELIVRAVNHHAELVEVLEAVTTNLFDIANSDCLVDLDLVDKAEALIKKAKGESDGAII